MEWGNSKEHGEMDSNKIHIYLTEDSRKKVKALQDELQCTRQEAMATFVRRYLEFTVE